MHPAEATMPYLVSLITQRRHDDPGGSAQESCALSPSLQSFPADSLQKLKSILHSLEGVIHESLYWNDAQPTRMPAGSSKLWIAVLAEPALETVRFLSWIKNHRGRTLVLTVVPAACLEYVLNHASSCLDEFVVEPATEAEFSHRVLKVLQPGLELERIASRVIAQLGSASLVGNSPKLLAVVEKLPKLACSEMQVLITGETGTGKELYARALHLLGPRRNLPFVTADCSVIPDHLFESEMFGHARGAFTDAHAERRGLAAVAAGGTLFLDEIDSLSTTAQAKLLRFV
jgi:DNA-binding NtrC family response regulator